ncbi:MAG: PLP-dependent aminotransferase family protein [Roseiflexaceae bacterium]
MDHEHPTLQIILRDGILDLGWGHPDPELLPRAAMRQAAIDAADWYGTDMLAYGHAAGAGPLLAWLRARISTNEGRDPGAEGMVLTGGNSLGLDQVCTLLANPGDVVLVESPTYHFAVKILRDHPLELVPVPADRDGLLVDRIEPIVARLQAAGKRVRMLYCVPTFHNPTGVSLPHDRRVQLVDLAERLGFLIAEDDVYRDLAYQGRAPESLWSLDRAGVVVRLGSFAKSLAPGVRLGWITAAPELVARIAGGGVLDSGGGVNHFAALTVAAFCRANQLDPHLERLRAAYRERSAILGAVLAPFLPPGSELRAPQGGFFTWLTLPEGWDTQALLPQAEQAGVSYIPGARFYLDPGQGRQSLRLAHSLYGPDRLAEAAERLGQVLAANHRA